MLDGATNDEKIMISEALLSDMEFAPIHSDIDRFRRMLINSGQQ